MSLGFKLALSAILGLAFFLFVEFVTATWTIQKDTEIAESCLLFDKKYHGWRLWSRRFYCPEQ